MTDTFQWERDAGGGFVDIGGATSSVYVPSGDTGALLRARGYRDAVLVGEAEAVGPVLASAPAGSILYYHPYTGVSAPDYGWGYPDWGFQNIDQTMPVALIPNGFRSGVPSLQATYLVGSNSQHVEGLKKWQLTVGEDVYIGLALKVHSPWGEPNVFWGVSFAQPFYQAFVNSTLLMSLHGDHARLVILSGQQSWTGTPNQAGTGLIREYNGQDDGAQGPAPRVISGGIVTDQWYLIILRVKAEYNSTGIAQAWVKGGQYGSWTQTVNKTGIPTLQWGVSNTGAHLSFGATGYNVSQKFGFYTGARSVQRIYEHASIVIATSLAAAQSVLG